MAPPASRAPTDQLVLVSRGTSEGAVIPLDILFNLLLGLGFATCARDRVRADGPFGTPAFTLVITFTLIILVPRASYLHLAHPDWTWMYLVEPDNVPGLALLPLLVAHAGAAVAGWYLAARLIRAEKQRALVYVAGGGGLVLLLAAGLLSHRLLHYGTYEQYTGDIALDLMDVKLGYVLVIFVLGTLAAAGFVALELMRDSRRVRTR